MIDYVSKNKNALGVVGVTWVSDRRDSTLMSFVNKVRVVESIPPLILPKEEVNIINLIRLILQQSIILFGERYI